MGKTKKWKKMGMRSVSFTEFKQTKNGSEKSIRMQVVVIVEDRKTTRFF
jgi:hypothetical protein